MIPEFEISRAVALAVPTVVALWLVAAAVAHRRGRHSAVIASVVASIPAVFLLGAVRDGWHRTVMAVLGLRVPDLVRALTYALGVAVLVLLAALTFACLLFAWWFLGRAADWLLETYRRLYPKQRSWTEAQAERRRELFATAVPTMRSSTYVVTTSPLDPFAAARVPQVPTPGVDGPSWVPTARPSVVGEFDGSLTDFETVGRQR